MLLPIIFHNSNTLELSRYRHVIETRWERKTVTSFLQNYYLDVGTAAASVLVVMDSYTVTAINKWKADMIVMQFFINIDTNWLT